MTRAIKITEEVANKIRADLVAKEKANLSDEYEVVREKYKMWKKIMNPNYNPKKRRSN